MAYPVLIVSNRLSSLGEYVRTFFTADCVECEGDIPSQLQSKPYRAMVLDAVNAGSLNVRLCERLAQNDVIPGLPLIVLTSVYTLQDKLKAFEIGCDDFIDGGTPQDEVCARITKSIFNHIANQQLNQRLSLATRTARNALVDNSDLGANIQFLLNIQNCDNFDELGQQFFATIKHYGWSCSLQMRSNISIKNMEPHGMAKELESQLLLQLKDRGPFVDFGKRSIINHDRVSLLIKNMPVGEPERCRVVKENMTRLIQGVNARVLALEERFELQAQKASLERLALEMRSVVAELKQAYRGSMKQVQQEVENASKLIQHRLPHLALNESDERFIDLVTETLVAHTGALVEEGLERNALFLKLDQALASGLVPTASPSAAVQPGMESGASNVVRLS